MATVTSRVSVRPPAGAARAASNIRQKRAVAKNEWASLRLRDRIAPGVRVLFVGINPGVRSAITGHHFAGYSNRFWKLLWDARLVPEAIGYLDDDRLPEWGFGITNLVPRPTPGIDDLRPAEYVDGWRRLARKIQRHRPELVAFIGVTLYRAILPLLPPGAAGRRRGSGAARRRRAATPFPVGLQPLTIHGARVFVLPNPSGRNANFSYADMRSAFRRLARHLRATRSATAPSAVVGSPLRPARTGRTTIRRGTRAGSPSQSTVRDS
jgi:double-stranded uracil-DNA glycosylase